MATHFNTDKQASSMDSVQGVNEGLGQSSLELQETLKLAGLLQTSLELEMVLGHFYEAIQTRVEFDGLQFEYEPLAVSLSYGKRMRHTCAYRLKLAGEFLGELIFSRRQRFAEQEMEILENMLSQLIYPLRNSIWYQRAVHSAQVDSLTGIHNRAAMTSTLKREVDLAHRNRTPLSLIVADIDHFKNINDQYGHSVGDEILKGFSQLIADNLRASDIVFRYGGEEFVVLLTGTNSEDATLIAERIREAVENHIFSSEVRQLSLTASFGAASLNANDTPDSLFKHADEALYQAKEGGRNLVRAWPGQNNRLRATAK